MQTPNQQFRNKRQQFTKEIRKQNRQQLLNKRRNIQNKSEEEAQKTTNSKEHIIDNRFIQQIKQYHLSAAKRQQFMNYLTSIHDPDILKQHYGVIKIRKLLTQKGNPPIQQVIDAGLIPKLIAYAKQSDYPQLQLQSVWCLTNVAAGNSIQTGSIIDKGGLKIFVDLLLSQHVGIVEQAIWVIGNIACDSASYRDMIVKNGGLKNLIKVIEVAISQLPKSPGMQFIIQTAVWSLSVICRTKPLPNYMLIRQALPVFFYVIKNSLLKDVTILGNVCWAMMYYTDKKLQGPTKIDKIQNCINDGVVPKLLQYFDNSYDNLVVPCIKIIGNIAAGSSKQSMYLIQLGIIPKLQQLLSRQKKIYRKQSCWVLSNLAAGSPQQIQLIFSQQSLIKKLLQMLQTDLPDVKSQICYFFANSIDELNKQKMLAYLTQINFLQILSDLIIDSTDVDLLIAAIQCLQSILKLAKQVYQKRNNNIILELHKLKLIPKLEQLQHHQDDRVYDQVINVISKYFQHQDPLKL